MLSAFAHQIQELDKKVAEQQSQLTDVKNHLAASVSNHPECQCQPALTNLQSQVDSNHFRLNDLTAKLQQLQTSETCGSPMCSEFSDSGPFYEDTHPRVDAGWRAPGSRGPTPNCLPDGYESPPVTSPVPASSATNTPSNLRYSAKEFFAAASFANASSEPDKMSQSPSSSPPKKCNPWLVDNAKIREPPASQNSNRNMKTVIGAGQTISVENITNIAAENSGLKQQLVTYRKKVFELEEKLKTCEASLQELRQAREHVVKQEREWTHRQEWYEHKLKLLKQDKRRRGETIGKLLKCIDDLKDSGRLDEGRVKEGRAVLAATLSSHGLHTEERICRVVEAVEYDRVPRTPPAVESCDPAPVGVCSPVDSQHSADHSSTNQNKNNSAFFSSVPSSESLMNPMSLYSERLAERHGFIPIHSPRYEDMMEMV